MKFDDASVVDSICYQMRLADYPRGMNRAKINNLFNGFPPFNEVEAEQNNINVNVNFLEGVNLAHDARAQFYNAFLKPSLYFTATTDFGDPNKVDNYGKIVTTAVNKIMKRNRVYFETFRSKFASLVLHGIGAAAWKDKESWCPDAIGIEDIGVPSNTLLTMQNIPFFYVYRSWTVGELKKMTKNRKAAIAQGWNMDLVDSLVEQVDKDATALMGSNLPEVWSPEKLQERVKGDGAHYAGDQVPTINCFDFYFYDADATTAGWRRRMVMDSWAQPTMAGGQVRMLRDKDKELAKGKFLFNAGERDYADSIEQLISFQFADLSAVAPFKYHSVRSLGFLTYSICNIQNRLRCRFTEAQFEALMNYYRVRSSDEAERALKVDLINRGFIDETINFVPQNERWQVNWQLIELGIRENRNLIESNTSGATNTPPSQQSASERKTRIQVMNEMTQSTALVQSAFNQAYQYQESEYLEILRRFFVENSSDPDVRKFRAIVLAKGVPPEVLNIENWEVQPTRVMGSGNQTVEIAIAQQLLEMRNLYDPEVQRDILRDVTFAYTGDGDKALRYVPENPMKVSDSIHDAQLSMGVLMQGLPVAVKTGMNHKEYALVLLKELEALIQKYEQQGGMAPADKIEGFQMVAQSVAEHLQILGQDPEEKQFVNAASQQLGKLMNLVKAFAQRLQQAMQKQQQQQGPDPKVQSALILAKTKAEIAKDTHAQKTAQKQIAWELEQKRRDAELKHNAKRENFMAQQEDARANFGAVSENRRANLDAAAERVRADAEAVAAHKRDTALAFAEFQRDGALAAPEEGAE
jgi:hypothetical protein